MVKNMVEDVFLQFVLILIAGFSLKGSKGSIILATLIISLINLAQNSYQIVWGWQVIIVAFGLSDLSIIKMFDRKTDTFRLLPVIVGSSTSALASVLFLPLGLLIWTVYIAIPLGLSHRKIPGAYYVQNIFKFIFFVGWLIIGNISNQ